jgi:hypothetical protein
MYLATFIEQLTERGDLLPAIAIVGGLSVGAIAIVATTIRAMVVSREREQTKRELAAYVAEGSLDPDKAVALLKADRPRLEVGKGDICCS